MFNKGALKLTNGDVVVSSTDVLLGTLGNLELDTSSFKSLLRKITKLMAIFYSLKKVRPLRF